jgi:hypothetical protein
MFKYATVMSTPTDLVCVAVGGVARVYNNTYTFEVGKIAMVRA